MAALITTNTATKKPTAKVKEETEVDLDDDGVASSSSEAETGDGWSQASDAEGYVPSPVKQKARQSRLTLNASGPSTMLKRASTKKRRPTVTLVVCPMTLLAQWKDELVRCDSRLNVHMYYGTARTDLEETIDEGVDVVITRLALSLPQGGRKWLIPPYTAMGLSQANTRIGQMAKTRRQSSRPGAYSQVRSFDHKRRRDLS